MEKARRWSRLGSDEGASVQRWLRACSKCAGQGGRDATSTACAGAEAEVGVEVVRRVMGTEVVIIASGRRWRRGGNGVFGGGGRAAAVAFCQ